MKRDDHEDAPRLVELGTVSGDTKGPFGIHWERVGMTLDPPGLSDD